MTNGEILSELYRRLYFASSPASEVTTRLQSFVNEAHRRLLTRPGMERLRDDIITFPSVAAQPIYGLPPTVARIKSITQRTNMRRLRFLSLDQLRRLDPGLTANGTPDFWVPIGAQAVASQPSAATGLWAVSSAGGDTTQKVFCDTILTGGYRHTTASGGTTLNGLTRVQLGSRTDSIEVVKLYLDAASTGFISLYDAAASGNELARIEPGKLYSRYVAIQLFPTPASAETFYVDYTRVIQDMSKSTDEPFLPEDFHWLLVTGALKREYEKKDDARFKQTVLEETDGVKALRNWVLYPPDYEATPQTVPMMGSNLGGMYPPGRW